MSEFNFQETMSLARSAAETFRVFDRLAESLREAGSFFKDAEAMEARVKALEVREVEAKAIAEKAETDAVATQEEVYQTVLAAQTEADRLIREAKEDVEREREISEAVVKVLRAEVEAVKAECDFKVKELREDVAAEESKLRAARARYDEFLASIKG